MNKIALIFGSISGLICGGMFFILHPEDGFDAAHMENGQWIGYLTMVIALSTIFFAVKQYRDKHLGGIIKFGKAFLVGLYVTVIASLVYVAAWELYSSPEMLADFSTEYVEYLRNEMVKEGISAEEIETDLTPKIEMMEMYQFNMPFRLAMTFVEIFPVGLIISLISALIFGVMIKPKNQVEIPT